MVFTQFAKNEAQSTIDEYYFRRIGLGISTLIITILSIALFVYIRIINREEASGTTMIIFKSI